eukprot:360600-Chlamydomonas_euryale.AAC.5
MASTRPDNLPPSPVNPDMQKIDNIWPWSYLVPFFKEDILARRMRLMKELDMQASLTVHLDPSAVHPRLAPALPPGLLPPLLYTCSSPSFPPSSLPLWFVLSRFLFLAASSIPVLLANPLGSACMHAVHVYRRGEWPHTCAHGGALAAKANLSAPRIPFRQSTHGLAMHV